MVFSLQEYKGNKKYIIIFFNLDTVEEKVNEMVDLKLCRTHQRRRTENIRKDVKRC